MKTQHAVLYIVSALVVVGCSKTEPSTSTTGAPVPAAAAVPGAGCADKMAALNPKATADEKKAYATACAAVSPKAQTCLAAAKAQKDMDACVTDKADKDAFMGAILGGAMKASAGVATTPNATKLDKLGLQVDVPGEANVGDGIGPKSQMVLAVALGGMTVSEAGVSTPKTLKAAKAEAQMFKPKNVKGEQVGDGYWLTFENTGSMGTNYWVKTLRTVGKKQYVCEGSPDTADKEGALLTACNTLRP